MSDRKYDVIIVGAGPAGIFTALELIEDPELLNRVKTEFKENLAKENSEV